ncbi:Cytochrome P450 4B1 [Dirofilaria immitis]
MLVKYRSRMEVAEKVTIGKLLNGKFTSVSTKHTLQKKTVAAIRFPLSVWSEGWDVRCEVLKFKKRRKQRLLDQRSLIKGTFFSWIIYEKLSIEKILFSTTSETPKTPLMFFNINNASANCVFFLMAISQVKVVRIVCMLPMLVR